MNKKQIEVENKWQLERMTRMIKAVMKRKEPEIYATVVKETANIDGIYGWHIVTVVYKGKLQKLWLNEEMSLCRKNKSYYWKARTNYELKHKLWRICNYPKGFLENVNLMVRY
jgi:hypothetical protein